ncbi:hypothetical protein [Acetobacter lambici]|uniref:Transposase n=1 Tax=Acetobacter lambici TaxID=1332824 RepID=A0ABT1F4V5_9PROT|nr:hypothetical protein [Acetobacter lambici]MCP1243992.1 hypothetical protein [Acetobacter lambici]MCP1260261.1 hypothetical protein [Acetobacter lambici]
MKEIIPEYGAVLCCFRRNGMMVCLNLIAFWAEDTARFALRSAWNSTGLEGSVSG